MFSCIFKDLIRYLSLHFIIMLVVQYQHCRKYLRFNMIMQWCLMTESADPPKTWGISQESQMSCFVRIHSFTRGIQCCQWCKLWDFDVPLAFSAIFFTFDTPYMFRLLSCFILQNLFLYSVLVPGLIKCNLYCIFKFDIIVKHSKMIKRK